MTNTICEGCYRKLYSGDGDRWCADCEPEEDPAEDAKRMMAAACRLAAWGSLPRLSMEISPAELMQLAEWSGQI